MAPILGIWASSFAKNIFTPTGSYDALATYTVPSGGVNTITFSGLPTGGQYQHLELRGILKTARATAGSANLNVNFNNDSTSSYASHIVYGNGASAIATAASTQTTMVPAFAIGIATGYTSAFTGVVMTILDYASTTKNKTLRVLWGTGTPNNDQLEAGLGSGLYYKTDAINTITISTNSTPLQQFSQLALYGIKGQ